MRRTEYLRQPRPLFALASSAATLENPPGVAVRCSELQCVAVVGVCSYFGESAWWIMRSVTATHCNMLQHPATHCNILQHPATHCDTLYHTATHYTTLQHTTPHCNTPPGGVARYGVASISRLLKITGLFCKRALQRDDILQKRDL